MTEDLLANVVYSLLYTNIFSFRSRITTSKVAYLFTSENTQTGEPQEMLMHVYNLFTRRVAITGAIFFFLLVAVISLYGLNQVSERTRTQNTAFSQAILNSTFDAIHEVWLDGLFLEANNRSVESVVVNSTQSLLATSRETSVLLKHPAQQKIRDYFREYLKQRDAYGIFIIAPDGTSLAAMRDTNIGSLNLISQYYPERLERVFSGQQQFIPPIPSDVPLPDLNGQMVEKYPTMFIVVPIKNENGHVLAALSVRLDPYDAFTKTAQTGRIGKSGETFFFDSQGRMITESRFSKQLRQSGLLNQDSHSILNLSSPHLVNHLMEADKVSDKSKQLNRNLLMKQATDEHSGDNPDGYRNYRGIPVLGVWRWDEELGIGIATQINEDEAMEPYRRIQAIVASILVATLLLGTFFYYFINRLRQKSINKIAKSEAYLSVVLDSALDGIVTINEQGIIQTFNRAAERLFGYSLGEVINKNVSMLLPEPHKNLHDSYLERYQTTGEAKIIGVGRDVEAQRKDGSRFHARLGISETWLNSERIFTAVIHDLTMQRKADKNIRRSEARFREMFEKAPIPYQTLDEDGCFVNVNNAFLHASGYTRAEIIGKCFFDFMDEESAMRTQHTLYKFKDDMQVHGEFVLHHKNGEKFDIELQGVVDRNFDGSFKQTHCVWHDVSRRKKAELEVKRHQEELESLVEERTEKLREKTIELQNEHEQLLVSEHLYRGLLEAAPDSIILLDEQGDIALINKTVSQMFGYMPEELHGQAIDMMIPERYIKGHKRKLFQYFKQPYIREGHTVNMLYARRKDGSEFPVDISLSPMITPTGTMVICDVRDISERIKMEEQLRQGQKMEEIGQLTGGIAHDFNNMLNIILGYTDLAMDLKHNPKNEKLEKYLQAVRTAGERASDLIARMMAFSRRTAKSVNEVINLKELLHETTSMLRPMLPSSIGIDCEIEGNDFLIKGDSSQITQVIMNLCVNARDALQERGHIQIQLRKGEPIGRVCSSCHNSIAGDFIEVCVSDNGSGIDVGTLSNIFDPFYTTKEVGRGTGLGLSMVHGIVHDSNGHVIVNSVVGEGTQFRLLFPRAEIKTTKINLDEENSSDMNVGDGQHIMVVDDEESIAFYLETLLTGHNYKVTCFSDSQDALDYFVEHQSEIDMVVSDQTMPKLTGTELAEILLSVKKDLPVILITGYSKMEMDEIEELSEIKIIMSKPIDAKRLVKEIGSLFHIQK